MIYSAASRRLIKLYRTCSVINGAFRRSKNHCLYDKRISLESDPGDFREIHDATTSSTRAGTPGSARRRTSNSVVPSFTAVGITSSVVPRVIQRRNIRNRRNRIFESPFKHADCLVHRACPWKTRETTINPPSHRGGFVDLPVARRVSCRRYV